MLAGICTVHNMHLPGHEQQRFSCVYTLLFACRASMIGSAVDGRLDAFL